MNECFYFSVMPPSGPPPMGIYDTFAEKTKLVHCTHLKNIQITSSLAGHTSGLLYRQKKGGKKKINQ